MLELGATAGRRRPTPPPGSAMSSWRPGRYDAAMPTYEFRCPTCETTFEEQRPMAQSGEPATCPAGHEGARRLLSVFANTSGSTDSLRAGAAGPVAPRPGGGGCCGGGCGGH